MVYSGLCVLWIVMPSRVPPNTTFEIDDMEDEWTYPDNHFDYIHMRSLSGSFADWDAVLARAYKWVPRFDHVFNCPF